MPGLEPEGYPVFPLVPKVPMGTYEALVGPFRATQPQCNHTQRKIEVSNPKPLSEPTLLSKQARTPCGLSSDLLVHEEGFAPPRFPGGS